MLDFNSVLAYKKRGNFTERLRNLISNMCTKSCAKGFSGLPGLSQVIDKKGGWGAKRLGKYYEYYLEYSNSWN